MLFVSSLDMLIDLGLFISVLSILFSEEESEATEVKTENGLEDFPPSTGKPNPKVPEGCSDCIGNGSV